MFRRIASAKKLRGNTRGVIPEMETCSLACARVQKKLFSREKITCIARGVFHVHASYLLFNMYNVLLLSRRAFPRDKVGFLSDDGANSDDSSDFSSLLR